MTKHFYSHCQRKFYVLPADKCADAAATFKAARDAAMRAKHEIWGEKYGAAGGISGGSIASRGLFYMTEAKARFAMKNIPGFASGIKTVKTDNELTAFSIKPNRSTNAGKAIHDDLCHVEDLLHTWEHALEKALDIDGTVFVDRAFHISRAKLLADGRVIASLPVAPPPRPNTSSNCKAPIAPPWAQEITEAEYRELAKLADKYEADSE